MMINDDTDRVRKSDVRVGTDWVIVLASAMHAIWGVLIIQSSEPYATTPIAGIHSILGDVGRPIAGGVLCLIAVLALASMFMRKNILTLVMLLPQEAFLVMSSTSVILAIAQGHYSDEIVRSRYFIAADQILYVLLALLYPCAIWRSYIWTPFRLLQRGVPGAR